MARKPPATHPRHHEERKTYTYLITNTINGHNYVGISVDYKRRWRIHKNLGKNPFKFNEALVVTAIRKYGVENFTFEIIGIANTWAIGCDHERLFRYFGMGQYNRTDGGDGVYGRVLSPESRKKIGDGNRGKKRTPEQVEVIRQSRLGTHLTEECKAKLSVANKGKTIPIEQREKISKAHQGKVMSEEARQSMAVAQQALRSDPEKKAARDAKEKATKQANGTANWTPQRWAKFHENEAVNAAKRKERIDKKVHHTLKPIRLNLLPTSIPPKNTV